MFLSSIFLSASGTNPSTIPRRITNPSCSHMLDPFRPVRSGVHDDLRNLALGHIRLFCFLFLRLCGFAPLRKSPSGKSGHCPLPGRVVVCHWPLSRRLWNSSDRQHHVPLHTRLVAKPHTRDAQQIAINLLTPHYLNYYVFVMPASHSLIIHGPAVLATLCPIPSRSASEGKWRCGPRLRFGLVWDRE